MAVFQIVTEDVTDASSKMSSLVGEVSSIGSEVSGYDTSCEDGFDFDGAKSVIARNIEACSIKIQNTATVLDTVVSSHDNLQNSLKFTGTSGSDNGGNSAGNNNNGGGNNNNGGGNNNNGGGNNNGGSRNNSGGGSTYTGGGSTYTGGGSTYSGGGSYGSYTNAATTAVSATEQLKKVEENKEDEKKNEITEVKTKLDKVGYAYADSDNLSEESKKLFEKVKYDEDGYAKIGNRYVISTDSSVGKVGDVIRFTKKDGTTQECIIGINTSSDKYKNSINFIIDKDKASSLKANEISKTILENNKTIENCGNYVEYDKSLESSKTGVSTTTTSTDTGKTTETSTDTGTTTGTSTDTGTTTGTSADTGKTTETSTDTGTTTDTSADTGNTTETSADTGTTATDNSSNNTMGEGGNNA